MKGKLMGEIPYLDAITHNSDAKMFRRRAFHEIFYTAMQVGRMFQIEKMKVHGRENLSALEQGGIFALNHQSIHDIFVNMHVLRNAIGWNAYPDHVVKDSLKKLEWTGCHYLLRPKDLLKMRRNPEYKALNGEELKALARKREELIYGEIVPDIVKSGRVMTIFPQGTRVDTPDIELEVNGTTENLFRAHQKTDNKPILPAHIKYGYTRTIKLPEHPKLPDEITLTLFPTVNIGTPILPSDVENTTDLVSRMNEQYFALQQK